MLASEIVRDIEDALATEEPQRGLHLVDHLLRTFSGHLRARTLRATALLALEEHEEAAGDAATVLSADLLNVDAMLVSAKLAEARGDLHQSHALIGRAASVDSGHSGVRQAVADSVTLLVRDPSTLGFSYLKSNWPDLAEREFRMALERDPARVDLRIALAEALWQQGRYEEARPECRIVLDHHPRCLRATLMMAHILAEQGRTAHGMEMLERAGEMDPEYEVAAELYAKATLSRMRLPPPPSLPDPPAFLDHTDSEIDENGDADGTESGAESDQDAKSSGHSPAVVFTAVDSPGADNEEKGRPDPYQDDGAEPDSQANQPAPLDDDARGVGEAPFEVAEAAPSVEFSAGWPAGKGQATETRGESDAEEGASGSAEITSPEGTTRSDAIETDEMAPESLGDSPAEAASAAESGKRAEVASTVQDVDTDPEDGTDENAAPEPHREDSVIADEALPEESVTEDTITEAEISANDVASRSRDASDEIGEPGPVELAGEAAVLAMAQIGSWDAVVDAVAEMLSGGEVEPVARLVEDLAPLPGYPTSIWRMLGDRYMQSSRPQLASEAYFRAVRRSAE